MTQAGAARPGLGWARMAEAVGRPRPPAVSVEHRVVDVGAHDPAEEPPGLVLERTQTSSGVAP